MSPAPIFMDVRNEHDFDALVAGLERTAARKLHEAAAAEGVGAGKSAAAQLRL